MIELLKVESSKKRWELNKEYIEILGSPIDGFWENVVIGTALCYQIKHDKKMVGHFFVDEDKTLVQFYVSREYYNNAPEIFNNIIKSNKVKKAAVPTKEVDYLTLCLDSQKSLEVDMYLFEDNQNMNHKFNTFSSSTFRLANKGDIDSIRLKCDDAYDGYYENLIENDNLFVLYDGNSLLGIGEFRIIRSNEKYGDIGVVVAEEYRRRGIGTYIIKKLKEHCYSKGLKPMACCDIENLASKSTLEKAGFIANHRVLNVQFK
ncbi:GNAT family N-acetyltransferase [Oceanirhabdus sp. W0125-5]|uniref:GNAT family N-acetyltransferase n=1 Tax=Oceanirhabdus sp. W0125-5 TaxID=2999116 RepID=UPI0022F2C235|nr:GNAT family N-acetyltransferase [Oceanirhabdus sp. W0125-5]WBW95169.1 GNAT family N-acetyltransferase [Oceanirhabdus sp. W0125-5]